MARRQLVCLTTGTRAGAGLSQALQTRLGAGWHIAAFDCRRHLVESLEPRTPELQALWRGDCATHLLLVEAGEVDLFHHRSGDVVAQQLWQYSRVRRTDGWGVLLTTVLPRLVLPGGPAQQVVYTQALTQLNTALREAAPGAWNRLVDLAALPADTPATDQWSPRLLDGVQRAVEAQVWAPRRPRPGRHQAAFRQ